MRINEIFKSIQGEGIYTYYTMVFVRLQGCNLIPKCTFCDTKYAQNSEEGSEIDIEDILRKISELSPSYKSWICITGGEPLWQAEELEELVRKLREGAYNITIETNGSFRPPHWYTLVNSWNADIKCPSSGTCGLHNEGWFRTRINDQVKFVVETKEDLEFTKSLLNKYKGSSPVKLVSPVIPRIEATTDGRIILDNSWLSRVAEFCLENNTRLSLQVQKFLWGNKRSV